MVISIKDAAKLFGISIIACCAVLVCTLFLNFYFDIMQIKDLIVSQQAIAMYEAQISQVKVVCIATGGGLLLTSVVMLLFYIKNYIDTHKKSLGILKAIGYPNIKIAKHFWVFGLSVLLGSAIGFAGAFCLMPAFYAQQNSGSILPEVTINFHVSILFCLVILPAVLFAALAIIYAYFKLKRAVLALLKDSPSDTSTPKKHKDNGKKQLPFIKELQKSTLSQKKSLVFFVIFSAFCFSAMTQMSFKMRELSSEMMGAMMLLIGLALALSTLFIAITAVVRGNFKTIAIMRTLGYSQKECRYAILDGYRPMSYIGFAVGTLYQHFMLQIAVDVVFADFDNIPEYNFDFIAMFVSLAIFIAIYELLIFFYSEKTKKLSVKEIMLD
ncbi:MAG: ABC transporter permease [Oscillospiraceae bacterium]|jgi:hypothetical protein|nr:ABC transporter permease [Oscillospiraceae bacterium]